MPDSPPATLRFAALDPAIGKSRLITLAAYGGALVLFHYAELLAEKVYNDLCSREGITFAKPTSFQVLVLIMIIFSIPTLVARSRTMILTNQIVSLITAAGAVIILCTSTATPYECFTMGGTYEDHTSGLEEFTLWGAFVLLLSFTLLFVDLFVWALKK
jgi:hypothetical protein